MALDAHSPLDLSFLASLLLEIAQERSLDQLLQTLVRRALEGPDSAIVVIWLIEPEALPSANAAMPAGMNQAYLYAVAGDANRLPGASGQAKRFPEQLARIPVGTGPIGRIASTRQGCTLTDLDKNPGELEASVDWFVSERVRAFAGFPIIYKDEVLGAFGGFSHTRPPDEIQQWGRVFADHIAGAIANARAFEEIQRLKAQLEERNTYLREEVVQAKAWGDLVGQSASLGQVINQIDLVAPTEASVLVLGETGTGKELVAYEIHRRSRRCEGPLIRVNCASIPRDLYESEFFGHARGAFTGAVQNRAGRFESAEGGTLFLDEIGEVPLDLQSKLLRVLQEKRYERVGEDITRTADVRVIAATNRDLKKEVEAGRFREDLYYRLNVFPIRIAALRERPEDILPLAQHFVRLAVSELRCPEPRLTRAGVAQLQAYDWPGNVRELRNVIERAVILARGGVLAFDVPVKNVKPLKRPPREANCEHETGFLTEVELRQRERENLRAVLEKAQWKIKGPNGAAELLGVKPTTLLSRMRVLGFKRPR